MPMKKNLTFKRLIKIMESIAPLKTVNGEDVKETVGDGRDDIVVWDTPRARGHLSSTCEFFVSVESSFLHDLLNGYLPNSDWKEHTELTEALDEYGCHWEWYDSVCFNIYKG